MVRPLTLKLDALIRLPMSRAGLKSLIRCSACEGLWVMLAIGRDGASKDATVDPADIRGLMPPYLRPSGACFALGTRMPTGLVTRSRVTPHWGGVASADVHGTPH